MAFIIVLHVLNVLLAFFDFHQYIFNRRTKGILMKKLLFIAFVFGLVGCDSNVDITRYPENIQECFNKIYYNDNNCTKSQKTIVKYCECFQAKYSQAVAQEQQDYDTKVVTLGYNNFVTKVSRMSVHDRLYEKSRQIASECADKTGYIDCPL